MMRNVSALWAVVVLAGAAQADWGASPTASGGPVGAALGPGYGPPPGYAPPQMPQQPMEGPHPSLMSYMGAPSERPPMKYGLLPSIKKLMWWKKDDCGGNCGSCANCGNNGAMYGGGAGGPPVNMGPAPQQGTLVFPNHPFVRGPRDYYMWEPR